MCGLVGIAGEINYQERKMFSNLLYLDTVRGPHSTGVCVVGKKDKMYKTTVYKAMDTPYNFFNKHKTVFDKGLPPSGSKLLMGHNRYATVGDINCNNAHPFIHGHIVGAHNGTLNKHMLWKLKDHKKFDVDSQVLFENIKQVGLNETYKNLDGAWAITYYNTKEKTLNIARNNQRPLFGAKLNDGRTFMWASEEWMLNVAAMRVNKKLDEVFNIEVEHPYTVDIETGKVTKGERLKGKVYVSTYKPKGKNKVTPHKESYNYQKDQNYVPFYISDYDEKTNQMTGWAFDDDKTETPIKLFVIARDKKWIDFVKDGIDDFKHWYIGQVIQGDANSKEKNLVLSSSLSRPMEWDEWTTDFTIEEFGEHYETLFEYLEEKEKKSGGEVVVPFPQKKTLASTMKSVAKSLMKNHTVH